MEFFETLRRRVSTRAYKRTGIPEEALWKILEAANSAPSAGNLQAYEIVVVRDPVRKRELAQAAVEQWFIAQAPVVLVFLANPPRSSWRYGRRGAELYCLQDATIACAYAQLAATALGLGSCWVGAFDEEAVRRILDAPTSLRPIAILPIGVPDETPEPRGRRPLRDLVHEERFRSSL
ncbi:MAG: nitroreductase family protein [Armatimonadota bacterium]|nr:nitroreductase family protein [Armatimonadota bacterium]MDR5702410.1 nitroreductase family protein [Armatimonadota bacterium]MDR7435604.1 nitroreductase family protein [Armatimonadota bacterium]